MPTPRTIADLTEADLDARLIAVTTAYAKARDGGQALWADIHRETISLYFAEIERRAAQ